jgi:hypothetical protein
VASGLEGGRAENDKAQLTRDPDESTPALAKQVAGPSVTMHHCRTIKRKTLSKQPKHHSASMRHKQLAAAQGSSVSPLRKKGSISLYSRIFTVASLGALPCAIRKHWNRRHMRHSWSPDQLEIANGFRCGEIPTA